VEARIGLAVNPNKNNRDYQAAAFDFGDEGLFHFDR
jgi:hypothetical protein